MPPPRASWAYLSTWLIGAGIAGALLVADDTGNTIWRVTAAPPAPPA